jgi:Fe-S oxidoreductase
MLRKFFRKLYAGNTLYYPGCLYKFAAKNLNENYIKILNKLKINFLLIDEFVCCGSPALNAGYTEDYNNLKKKNIALLDKYGIGTIITPCAACYKMLKKEYGLDKKGVEVKHMTQILNERAGRIKRVNTEQVTYHDPCHLGRHCQIYDEPRNILRAIGLDVKEFSKNRQNATCCGAGAGVKANFPDIANKIAQKKMKEVKTKYMVTACPLCHMHFKENAPENVIVRELSEFVLEGLQ